MEETSDDLGGISHTHRFLDTGQMCSGKTWGPDQMPPKCLSSSLTGKPLTKATLTQPKTSSATSLGYGPQTPGFFLCLIFPLLFLNPSCLFSLGPGSCEIIENWSVILGMPAFLSSLLHRLESISRPRKVRRHSTTLPPHPRRSL